MGSHSYLQNLGDTYVQNYQAQGVTNFLNQFGHGNTQVDNLLGTRGSTQNFGLQQLGDTYVQNYQAQGVTNFNNQYGHGNTQVDNLMGTPGSIQNFGLQNLMIGPAWTFDPSIPKPLGSKDMGTYQVAIYTPEQLTAAQLVPGMLGSVNSSLYDYEMQFNGY